MYLFIEVSGIEAGFIEVGFIEVFDYSGGCYRGI